MENRLNVQEFVTRSRKLCLADTGNKGGGCPMRALFMIWNAIHHIYLLIKVSNPPEPCHKSKVNAMRK